MLRITILFVLVILNTGLLTAQKMTLADYNIVWNTPGINSQGSMPLGNGDIGINAWVEENGDLVFYVSKTDAWSEMGQLLKLGKIRLSLHPNQFASYSFSQILELQKGRIVLKYGSTNIILWVDANHPTIQIDIVSKDSLNAKVSFETWRKVRREIKGIETSGVYGVSDLDAYKNFVKPVYQEPDTILSNNTHQVISCHHNTYSAWKSNLELQSLGDFANKHIDPLLYRTHGICLEGSGLINDSDTSLISKKPSNHFQINVYPLTQIGTIATWEKKVQQNIAVIKKGTSENREVAHNRYWRHFWDQHYIFISSKDSFINAQAKTVTRGYILQRFINACAGRGNSPIKFNGSIFTVDTYNRVGVNAGANADFRAWGGPFWWQNTRLPYWSMLIAGDFDLMRPLFNMYMNALPIRKAATKKYYHHAGAFFPETLNFWGTYTNTNYGTNRTNHADGYVTNNYIRNYWQSGLELSLMMEDYYAFTNSGKFAKDTLVPFVSEILSFFNNHWHRADNGKILFSPATSLETFQNASNPLPEIVGIRKVAEKMMRLPDAFVTDNQRREWKKLMDDLPPIPIRMLKSDTLLAPAAVYGDKQNIENPELYAIFPYRVYGIDKPGIDIAKRTFAARAHTANVGWQQNSIQAACIGLTEDAKKMVVESFSVWDKNFRFPAFWGPNYDWTPDQDHGSVAMNALQRMIMQYEDKQVLLLPAWPLEWDLRFKVSGPGKTTIEGIFKDGKMVNLKTTPKNTITF
jgi:alpha-L-fucosidase 2